MNCDIRFKLTINNSLGCKERKGWALLLFAPGMQARWISCWESKRLHFLGNRHVGTAIPLF